MKKQFPNHIISKAESICQALRAGEHWSQIGGRKLHFTRRANRPIVVFDLPGWHRLVLWFTNGMIIRCELMTHARYNGVAANTRR